MKRIRLVVFFVIIFILAQLPRVNAQVEVSVNPHTAVVGERVSVAYSLLNVRLKSNPTQLKYNEDALELLYGPAKGTSSSYSNINGKQSSQHYDSFTYTFLATKEGTYTISGFSVETDKGLLTAKAVQIKILKQSQNNNSTQGAGHYVVPEFKTELSKSSLYQNEAGVLDYKLYINDNSTRAVPQTIIPQPFVDLATQDIENDRDESLDRIEYKGAIYTTYKTNSYIVIPEKVGEIKLPQYACDLIVTIPSEDSFWGVEQKQIRIKSSPKTIKVKPLPLEGRPSDFSGAVGHFRLKLGDYENTKVKTNEAFTLKLFVVGEGNLKYTKFPQLNLPQSFEAYPMSQKLSMTYDKERAKVISAAEIDYLFIPRKVGNFQLDPISFSFFNPNIGQYKTIATEPINLNVLQGKEVEQNTIIKEEDFSNDILSAYRTGESATALEGLSLLSISYLFYYLIPLFLLIAWAFSLRYMRGLRQDMQSYRSSRASKVAIKRLKKSKKYMQANDVNAFNEEMLRALWGYIADKFKMSTDQLSRENIQGLFTQKGFDDELSKRYCELIDELEFMRYTSLKADTQLETLYNSSLELLTMIEKIKK